MKFQAFVERVTDNEVHLYVYDQTVVLPRSCLPPKVQEADIIDVIVFVNEKATHRRLDSLRRWLLACGDQKANGLRA